MGAITHQPQVSREYVAMVERQNRMLKRLGAFLFFLSFMTTGLIALQLKRISRPAAPQGQTKIISATEFDLVDQNGKNQGLLSGGPNGAVLILNGPNGKAGLMFYPSDKSGGSSMSLTSVSGEEVVELTAGELFSSLAVGTKEISGDKIQMIASSGDQSLTVSNKAGLHAVLGDSPIIKLGTGSTTETSMAALTLFGKDGRESWIAPKSGAEKSLGTNLREQPKFRSKSK